MHESSSQDVVVKTLLKKSKEVLDVWEKEVKDKIKSKEDIYYEVLSKIGNMPHLFVLGCIMDRQIPAERAWAIPEKVFKYFNCDTIPELAKISEQDYINCFVKEKLHRFNEIEGQCFYEAVQRIHDQYKDNAANIWQNNASAADVIERFKEFKGCGDKIATMATNILQRDLGVKFSDYSAIDVSPDVHVCRVLYRLGLTSSIDDTKLAMEAARKINPAFPGIIDLACWKWGREICNPSKPNCKDCPLDSVCPKNGLKKRGASKKQASIPQKDGKVNSNIENDYNIAEFEMGGETKGLDECVYIKHNGLKGIIRKTDKTVIVPPKYKFIGDFKEGRAMVEIDGKYGFIDHNGKEVIECKYDYVGSFEEGIAGKYGFIDHNGKEVIECKYDYVGSFEEGIAKVEIDDNRGFIDHNGKEITKCIYYDAGDFEEGRAPVLRDGEGWGYIDLDGNEVIDCIYYESFCRVFHGITYYINILIVST